MKKQVTIVESTVSFVPKGFGTEYIQVSESRAVAFGNAKYAGRKMLQRITGEIGCEPPLPTGEITSHLYENHGFISYHMVSKETGREYYVYHGFNRTSVFNGYQLGLFETMNTDILEEVYGEDIEAAVEKSS